MLSKACPGFEYCDEAPDTMREDALSGELLAACERMGDDAPESPRRSPEELAEFMGEGCPIDIHGSHWDDE